MLPTSGQAYGGVTGVEDEARLARGRWEQLGQGRIADGKRVTVRTVFIERGKKGEIRRRDRFVVWLAWFS